MVFVIAHGFLLSNVTICHDKVIDIDEKEQIHHNNTEIRVKRVRSRDPFFRKLRHS